MDPRYTIRTADTAADLALVHAVRRAVFIEEQQIPEDEEWDDLDPACVHLVAVDADGAPLGTGRLVHGEAARKLSGRDGTVLLGRLAVLPAARGTGLGAALVRAVEEAGVAHGGAEMELHAQVQALGFYQRLGYRAHGPEFLDAGIPHRTMVRALSGPRA